MILIILSVVAAAAVACVMYMRSFYLFIKPYWLVYNRSLEVVIERFPDHWNDFLVRFVATASVAATGIVILILGWIFGVL